MRKKRFLQLAAAALCLATSCIVSDQLTTLTILPDGSADWVRFQSNIRSTEKGDKGAEELKRFVEEFTAQEDEDCVRIRASGGEVLDARWVRQEEPYATVVSARFPGATALQNFWTFKNDRGETIVETRFTKDGTRRRLTLAVRLPKSDPPAAASRPGVAELRQEQASGLSETRFAVSGGQILSSLGFTVAADRRSALLATSEIQDLLQARGGQADLFLEWDLAGH